MVKSSFTPSHLRSQGLEETSATQNDVCRVELLMAKVRVEAQGRAGAQRWVKNVFLFSKNIGLHLKTLGELI